MDLKICNYKTIKRSNNKTVIINCRNCKYGNSTIFDRICRKNILQILQKENNVSNLVLNHEFVKVFRGKELAILKDLKNFIDILSTYKNIKLPIKSYDKCKKCNEIRTKQLLAIINISKKDPIKSYFLLKKIYDMKSNQPADCQSCNLEYKKFLDEIISKADFSKYFINNNISIELFYRKFIRPYVRPGFIDSYIQLQPPADAVFLKSYEISGKGRRPINISHYRLTNRPEKLYFIIPPEYELPKEELLLLEKVR